MYVITNEKMLEQVSGGKYDADGNWIDDSPWGDESILADKASSDKGGASAADALATAKCAIDAGKAYASPNPLNIAAAITSCAPVAIALASTVGQDQAKSDAAIPYKANQY